MQPMLHWHPAMPEAEESALLQPAYDVDSVTPGIAHFGVGNFHRSHQAMYLDRLMALGVHNDWGIIGIGVMPGDAAMRDALTGQNYRYTLVAKANDGSLAAREIASIRGFLFAPDDPEAVLYQLVNPAIRIVSLTITEGGYNIDPETGEFDLQNPGIQRDLADSGNPATVFGYITEALRRRRDAGVKPFTVMSCDNLPGNGEVTRRAILSYAGALDESLAGWIDEVVAFPNSMVDRITPVTTDADRELVAREFGIDDAWPVVTEPFSQWVLEENFCNDRPAFEQVGVQITDDVAPYELMKLRLLNGSHQAMAYVGILSGYEYVHEAVSDPAIERFLRAYLSEARRTLHPVSGIDAEEYIETLFERFRNPHIADTLARLAVDASDRIPKFVLPAIRDNLAAGRPITMGAAVVASWQRYLQEHSQIGDAMSEQLLLHAVSHRDFVRFPPVFGSLAENGRFLAEYSRVTASLADVSCRDWAGSLTAF